MAQMRSDVNTNEKNVCSVGQNTKLTPGVLAGMINTFIVLVRFLSSRASGMQNQQTWRVLLRKHYLRGGVKQ